MVTDLDNTLWDWFDAWYRSFSAMLRSLSRLSGITVEVLEKEMQAVHRLRGTTEYSYLLNELPSLCAMHPGGNPLEIYDEAMHVLNSERKKATALYPGVAETLRKLRALGVPVVAYTESVAYWSEWRIKTTRLDGLIGTLYSSPDHDMPKGVDVASLRRLPPESYGLKNTEHRHVPPGLLKPDPHILETIVHDYGVDPGEVVYVGDSLMKDVAMAQDVGVVDVHAAYGVAQERPGYDLLRRVSHWTQEDIERERLLSVRPDVVPSHVLHRFSDLMDMFDFEGRR